jgi:hydroxyacylglutathione hydrolase
VAAIVDPQANPSEYLSAAGRHELRITEVMETHVHADHPSGARELAERVGVVARLGAGAKVEFDFQPLSDGDIIEVGNRRVQVIHTPGHTPEHVSLLIDDWFVLTGDTLFVGDVGRVDLALEDVDEVQLRRRARQLHASLHRLLKLSPETEVYPGHYAGSTCGRGMDGKTISTIGREKRFNRALSLGLQDFIDYQVSNPPPVPEDFQRIKRTNLGFDDSKLKDASAASEEE